ncbi:hypothetical protein AYI68_g6992, partial [Smittium mucronatum]
MEINKKFRKKISSDKKNVNLGKMKLKVMTFNIRGVKSAKPELELLLQKSKPDILLIQETFLSKKSYRCRIPGYTTIESKTELTKGGNGLLIGVRNQSGLVLSEFINYPTWMVGLVQGKTKRNENFRINVVNVHMPSWGIRKKRTMNEIQSFLKNRNGTKDAIIFAGDFNMDIVRSDQFLKKSGIDFEHSRVSNSSGSRWNKNDMGRMIDHIFYYRIGSRPNWCIANKYLNISDHFPITTEWDISAITRPPKKRKINVKKMELVKDQLISSNRFDLLATDRIDINQSTKELIDTIWEETDRLGAITDLTDPSEEKKIFLSTKTIKKIKKKQKVFRLFTKSKIDIETYIKAKNVAEKSKKQDSKKFYEKKLMKLNEYLTTNESQKMWNFIKFSTGKIKTSITAGPVLDPNNVLITDSESKLKVWETHFKNLAKDSTGNSRTTEKWESLLNNDVQIFPECDDSITWYDITSALKNIPNNKSPGMDGIPNEVWKLVSSEASPTSKVARIIFRILKIIWDTGKIPETMTTSIIVPVPKKGNLQDPNNYR